MPHIVVIPRSISLSIVRALGAGAPTVDVAVGLAQVADTRYLLVRQHPAPDDCPADRRLTISLNRLPPHGWARLMIRDDGGWQATVHGESVQELHVCGADPEFLGRPADVDSMVQWVGFGRTIGALGEPEVWQRLRSLRYGIVGCGRTGSLLLHDLVRMGIARRVVLVDPDHLERDNLPDMDLLVHEDVGRPKAIALAQRASDYLRAAGLYHAIEPFTLSVLDQPPDPLMQADVWIGCVDNNRARLYLAFMATLYHKTLLDIGTAVQRGPERRMGADIRLLVPGEGCLECLGGVSDQAAALRTRDSGSAGPWWSRRAGSLRTLNQMAVGLALQQLIELVTNRLHHSRWLQLELDPTRGVTQELVDAPSNPACPLCRWTGLGDAGRFSSRDISSRIP